MAKNKIRKPEYILDIIIPVYGQASLLAKCLDSLKSATISYRLILVDDCGPEQEQLEMVYGSLNGTSRLLRNRENSGFARTVNTGVNIGNAPFILLLNSDIELQHDTLTNMLAEFDNSEVGVVGPKLLFADNRHGGEGKIQHAGLCVTFQGQLVHANIGWNADHPKVNQRREMQAVTGACLMTRRAVWQKILAEYRHFNDPTMGAMNEIYGKGCFEDVEYCMAARAHGYKVIYAPNAIAKHYVGASILGNKEAYPINRNAMIFGARCGHLIQWDDWKWM